MPIDVRSTSLAVLALIASVVFAHWAQAVLIPITFALLLSYALTPVVNWLKRRARLHKAIGAALTLAVLLGALWIGLRSLQPEMIDILDLVPRATTKLTAAMRSPPRAEPGAVAKIQKAATEIEKAANTAAAAPVPPAKPAPETPAFKIRDYILMGTVGIVAGIGQLVLVVALVYFLLVAGDMFRRTLIRFSGDTLSKKKITVQILDEIEGQIQRYLLVQIAASALVGIIAWLVFSQIGLANAVTWGCVGGVLHLVPYVGPTAFIALIALVAYVQFDTVQPVLIVVSSMLANVGVIGLLLVPWLTGRVGNLNAVAVFVTLLAWGWLWGIWGLLLGVPIMVAVKAVCERVEELQPIAAFLGHGADEEEKEEEAPTIAIGHP